MPKNSYFIQSFMYVLLSIFFLVITETQVFNIIYKYSLFKEFTAFIIVNALILLFWILSIMSFYKFSQTFHKDMSARQADLLHLEESSKLILTLQSQRHDYRNQLQVIRMLAQYNKTDEIIRYIDEYVSMANVSAAVPSRIDNSAVSALLLVYETEAKDKEIAFNIDSDIDFSKFKYSPLKVTRILGNIIRNALEILQNLNLPTREIQVTMWETATHYVMAIWNNGTVISEADQEKIFRPGFSTKNSSGLGLSIVKELVEEISGRIEVSSSEESGTEFKILLPRKEE